MRSAISTLILSMLAVAACGGDDPQTGGVTDTATETSATDTIIIGDGFDVSSTATDTGPDLDTGGFDDQACEENIDCNSGYCMLTSDGFKCAQSCIDTCPEGFGCRAVAGPGGDPAFVCLDLKIKLCQPCREHADCNEGVTSAPALCLSRGDEGSFCGLNCGPNGSDCPDGYSCEVAVDATGAPSAQCMPTSGTCECNGAGIALQLETECGFTNTFGTCAGSRVCGGEGLGACDAPPAETEVCNLVDDDCDGITDESVASDACFLDNEFGRCPGTSACEGGEARCNGIPAVPEACDGQDQNCDGQADDGFPDLDADRVADCMDLDDDGDGTLDAADNCPLVANVGQSDVDFDQIGDACDGDADGDLAADANDCAPLDPNVHPGAVERCNGADDDCDETVDEGFSNLDGDTQADCVDEDDDGDTFIDSADNCPVTANNQSDLDQDGRGDACEDDTDGDFDPNSTDCAPTNPAINARATELCDGVDDNCNGITDEGFANTDGVGAADCLSPDDDGDGDLDAADNCPLVANADQADLDNDLIGDVCDGDDDGDGAPDLTDCAPRNAARHPGAIEACGNQLDDDCDGQTDEENATGCEVYYFNLDNDVAGIALASRCLCAPTAPYTATQAGDCNDQNPQIFPGANEVCGNNADDNCNQQVDEPGALNCVDYYVDGDDDGYGTTTQPTQCRCNQGTGYAPRAGDCNDAVDTINPGALERCGNAADDNCNQAQDEAGALDCSDRWFDQDDDGWGQAGDKRCLCADTGLYRADQGGDCNDGDADNFPSNAETCDDEDNNCNGQADEGVRLTFYKDNDNDGYGGIVTATACTAPAGFVAEAGDCNDFNAAISPSRSESCNDVDDDCDGFPDDGLAVQRIYRDNDGDFYAAAGAQFQDKCNRPVGWAYAQDPDEDGDSDWDCNDSDVLVHPYAATICGDGKDNDCDGYVDRLCYTQCDGDWPFQLDFSGGVVDVTPTDLNGDGNYEVVVQDIWGFAILDRRAQVLFGYSADGNHNYSRNAVVMADIDDAASFGPGMQTLEVLTGNGSVPHFYKLNDNHTVTDYTTVTGTTNTQVYDASPFMARDVDNDGVVDFLSTSWCNDAQATRRFEFNTGTKEIVLQNDVANPQPSACQYTNGRLLTDIDGDHDLDHLFGNGYAQPTFPQYWSSRIYLVDPLTGTPFCPGGGTPGTGCFNTEIAGLFGGSVVNMRRVGNEIRAQIIYFLTNVPNQPNASTQRFWRFDLQGQPLAGSPSTSSGEWVREMSDVNNDGVLENFSEVLRPGFFDVDGDRFPDYLVASGTNIDVRLWNDDTKSFVSNPGSAKNLGSNSVAAAAWDLDADGRIELLSYDSTGRVHCHHLGLDTWHPRDSLPPRQTSALRTYQWDNYEPNEGQDLNADGMPDASRYVQLPSALTAQGHFASYLSTPDDKDTWLLNTDYGNNICVTAPRGFPVRMKVYLFDYGVGRPGGLIYTSVGSDERQCWNGSLVQGNPRYGEYRMILTVEPVNATAAGVNPFWPYWIHTPR